MRPAKASLTILTLCLASYSAMAQNPTTQPATTQSVSAIKVCQVGYLPGEPKFAMLTAKPAGDAVLRNADTGDAVLTIAASTNAAQDRDSGDAVYTLDFSQLRTPGTYLLDVPGLGTSFPFRVADDAFSPAFRAAIRAFTGQRCGTAVSLAPDFPQFHYDACHLDPAEFHASSGKVGRIDLRGGWHDAGDYGRYIVNSGITTGTLLHAYALYAPKLRSLRLDIPESGASPLPDFLSEVKWNLDWMLKMQDPADGGVWHKATSANFCSFVMPADDKSPVLVIGSGHAPFKTTEATADFAAVCTLAARVYRPFDPAYADGCLAAARRAFAWAQANPDQHFKNPDGIKTGGYGDRDASDELLWAAAELFATTGDAACNDYFVSHHAKWSPTIDAASPQSWPNVHHLAMYAYALSNRPEANPDVAAKIRSDATAAADAIVKRARANPYRIPMKPSDYIWGSNSVAANYGVMLLFAHRLQPDPQYRDAAQDILHYLLGRNTFNTSFVTQVGSRWPMHPHHRPSGADKVDQPWPGMLVGGPNANGKSPPARQWHDDQKDYTTNEIAINWNAPLVFLLAEPLPDQP